MRFWRLASSVLVISWLTTGGAVVGNQAGQGRGEPRPYWLTTDEAPTWFEQHDDGQNIAPVFEGWHRQPDGSFDMLFGYFNRNWTEQPHVPVGPNNNIEPGGPDRGQPTHFFPRRNKFLFSVRVPKDFGKSELVWTLTVNGKTERAYATLNSGYELDKNLIQTNSTMSVGLDLELTRANVPPVIRLEGDKQRTVKVGEALSLNATVTDDGIFKPKALANAVNSTDNTAFGLRVAWFVWRGPGGQVTFSPKQFTVYQDKRPVAQGGNSPYSPGWAPPPPPPGNKYPVSVNFQAPGTYVLRLFAHDGGLSTAEDTTVVVVP